MTNEQFEDFARNYPDLFSKSGDFELSVNDGWYNIIDSLFQIISSDVESKKEQLKYALENLSSTHIKPIHELEASVVAAIEELPTIRQVKEKFGGLRFYINGGNNDIYNYISFAELLSIKTCQVCGSPGKQRSRMGWISTLCDTHYAAQEE